MIDMLECTLWQRQLAALPEETVGALVAQVRSTAAMSHACNITSNCCRTWKCVPVPC